MAADKPVQTDIGHGISSAEAGKVFLCDITKLRPDPKNARKHSRAQIRAIAKSIHAFGFNAPVLIDRHLNIIAGEGRFHAARSLGMIHLPAIILDHLSERQAQAYALADNKLTDRSSFFDDKLAAQLKELSEIEIDFDIEATGFDAPEIDFRIQSLENIDDVDKADEFDVAEGHPVSVLGDVWHLDKHRILCRDATSSASYQTLLRGEKAGAVFADPPYNQKIDGFVSGNGHTTHREFPMGVGEMSEGVFTEFLATFLKFSCEHTHPGALIYSCIDWRGQYALLNAGRAAECDLINVCIWVKPNGGMGSLYRSRYEVIHVLRNGKAQHLNNVQLGRHGRNRSNVWNYPGANSFPRRGHRRDTDVHPTVKPILMVSDIILDSTRRNDIVLDPFLGSGATVLAAERTKRRAYGIELDPLYVDTAVQRWQKMTGKTAHHENGETFEAIRRQRGSTP